MKFPARFLPLAAFFVLACLLSFLITRLPRIPLAGIDARDVLAGFGPLLSGLICYRVFKVSNALEISATGGQPLRIALVVLAVAATHILTRGARQSPGAAIVFVTSEMIYCLGEEFGWRHFLMNATQEFNRFAQAFIIGALWFGWHFSFLPDPLKTLGGSGSTAPAVVLAPILLVLLSFYSLGVGTIVTRTGALALPVVIHFGIKSTGPALLVAVVLAVLLTVKSPKKTGAAA